LCSVVSDTAERFSVDLNSGYLIKSNALELVGLQNRLVTLSLELQVRAVELGMRRARLDAQEEELKQRQLEELSKTMKLKQV